MEGSTSAGVPAPPIVAVADRVEHEAERSAMGRPPYVLIVGNGRSGTNFLLNLLDLSPLTHCRNEPDAPDCPSMAHLPQETRLFGPQPGDFAERWDRAVRQAHEATGQRDPYPTVCKRFYRPWAYRLGLCSLMHRTRLANLLRPILPAYEGEELRLPAMLCSRRMLAESMPVLKVNYVPGWAGWVAEHRPDVQIVHITRHPGGFLRSWRNRWKERTDEHALLALNRERLRRIGEQYPQWAEQFGDIDALGTDATELWFWRFVNEQLHAIGQQAQRYHHVIYEQLTLEPLKTTRRLYEACGLEWDETIAEQVREHTSHSKAIAEAWRRDLTDEQIVLVEQVLETSLMREWW